MNISQLNDCSIIDLLDREGFSPVKKNNHDWWYISPIREKERSASFKVDINLNRWYDHGIGVGGKLFDLAIRLYWNLDSREVVRKLSEYYSSRSQFPAKLTSQNTEYIKENNRPKVKINRTQSLGNNKAITEYIESRGISIDTAKHYCEEVYFAINERKYFAVGFKNRSGGYELRNAFFKGSSSPKDITFFDNQMRSISVFEGFFDFLSMLMINRNLCKESNYLILNSNSNISKALTIIKSHEDVNLYLNNDQSGKKTLEIISQSGISIIDNSALYKGYNDLNDYLIGKWFGAEKIKYVNNRRKYLGI